LIEREARGGQAGTSSRIENYLGFPVGLSGADLARRAVEQAERFGVEFLTPQTVAGMRVDGQYRYVTIADGSELSCHALLIATGVSYRKLQVPGSERLEGAGVYYGSAMTEALSCQDANVYIVGGANSAGQASVYLSRFAHHLTILVREDSLAQGMSQYLIDQIGQIENISIQTNAVVTEVRGKEHLEEISINNTKTGETTTVPADAMFVFIGALPYTDWVAGILERDEYGFILTGPDVMEDGSSAQRWPLERHPYLLEASVPGVFVAGDVRSGSVKRVASAVGEGSVAVMFIHRYLAAV
jgi:thioredoxin reductase (NADPH)